MTRQDQSTTSRKRRSGLGRGLEALIPETRQEIEASGIQEIAVSAIRPNPYQPRTEFEPDELAELVDSIRVHGLIQPVIVSTSEDGESFVLIAGERRLRASEEAGLQAVPAVIRDATSQEMLEIALVENVMRSDLSPLEEANAYRQLIDDFSLTQQEVADRVGKSRASVANTLRLLMAPDRVKEAIQSGLITEGHARALLSLTSAADQLALLEIVVARDLTVRQTEAAVRRELSRDVGERRQKSSNSYQDDPFDRDRELKLQRSLSTDVRLRRGKTGAGSIAIQFSSDEQLAELISKICGDSIL